MATIDDAPIGGRVRTALAWSAAGSFALRLGNLAVGVLLARLIAPAEFGIFAVALTVQAVVIAVADLGLSAEIVRNGYSDRQGTVTTLAVGCGSVLALSMSVLAQPLATAVGTAAATNVLRVMSITLILAGLSVVPYGILQREFRQSTQMKIDASNLVLSTAVTLALVAGGMGAMALAISRVASQLASTVLQYTAVRLRPRFSYDRALARKLIIFGLPLAMSNIVSWLAISAGQIVVAPVAGPTMLAFYVLAFNISMWPMTALGVVVRSVALPAFARLTDRTRKASAFVAAASLMWAVALLGAACLGALSSVLVPLIYGARWSASAAALGGLACVGAIRILFDLIATYLVALGATRVVFISQVMWTLILIPACWVGLQTQGLAGAGWSQAIGSTLVMPYLAVQLAKLGDVDTALLLRRLGRPLLSVVVALSVGVVALRFLSSSPHVLQLFAGCAVMVLSFLATSYGWLRQRYADLRQSDNVQAQVGPIS